MNKLILTTLFLVFLATSCIPRTPKGKDGAETVEVESQVNADAKSNKPKYKADIREELQGLFTHQVSGKVEQVTPKHVSANGYGIYSYFFLRNKKAVSLKLHIQYPDYDADVYEIVADDKIMEYEVNKSYQAEGSAMVVENATFRWYDNAINLADEEFIRNIQDAESVTLNMKSKKGNRLLGSIKLTKKEITSLEQAIDYYKSLDGAKIPKKGMVNIRSY